MRPNYQFGPQFAPSFEENPDYDPNIQIALPSNYRKASAAVKVTGAKLHPLLKSAVSQAGYQPA